MQKITNHEDSDGDNMIHNATLIRYKSMQVLYNIHSIINHDVHNNYWL